MYDVCKRVRIIYCIIMTSINRFKCQESEIFHMSISALSRYWSTLFLQCYYEVQLLHALTVVRTPRGPASHIKIISCSFVYKLNKYKLYMEDFELS